MAVKILPLKQFRLLKDWAKLFKITDDTVIAYGNVIYSNKPLYPDVLEQQKRYGLTNFTKKYLNDKKFRLEMEVSAFKTQFASIQDTGLRDAVIQDAIIALSSGLYGKVTVKEAKKLLGIREEKKLEVSKLA